MTLAVLKLSSDFESLSSKIYKKHCIIGFRIYLNSFEPVNGLCSPDRLYKQLQSRGSVSVQPAQSAWGVPSPRQYGVKSSTGLLMLITPLKPPSYRCCSPTAGN